MTLSEEEQQALLGARERSELWEMEADFRTNLGLGRLGHERAVAALGRLVTQGLIRVMTEQTEPSQRTSPVRREIPKSESAEALSNPANWVVPRGPASTHTQRIYVEPTSEGESLIRAGGIDRALKNLFRPNVE